MKPASRTAALAVLALSASSFSQAPAQPRYSAKEAKSLSRTSHPLQDRISGKAQKAYRAAFKGEVT